MLFGMEVGFGASNFVLDGDAAPTQFSARVYCGQTAGWIEIQDSIWHGCGPRSRRHCARWGSSSLSKRGQSPQFPAHCDQTAGWIKMPLGTEVGLDPGNVVLDGDPAPPKKGKPQFAAQVYCGQTAVCIRMQLGTEVGFSLVDIVLDGHPALPPLKRHSAPNFWSMSVAPKQLDGLRCIPPPFPQIDIIGAVMFVWRVRGKLSGLFCAILCATIVHSAMHTHRNRLTGHWIGFCRTGLISLCLDSFLCMYVNLCIFCMTVYCMNV